MKTAILYVSEASLTLAHTLQQEFTDSALFSTHTGQGVTTCATIHEAMSLCFEKYQHIIFIGALGICVRALAPCIRNKYRDPAVVCLDTTGHFVIPVLSGHVGGANELALHLARITGGVATVTTQSDRTGLWALDTLGATHHWQVERQGASMNECIFRFVNAKPTALVVECQDAGVEQLLQSVPAHVTVFHPTRHDSWKEVLNGCSQTDFELIIVIGPYCHPETQVPVISYRPALLHLGFGCKKECNPAGITAYIEDYLMQAGLSPRSLATISTHQLKAKEPLLTAMQQQWPWVQTSIYTTQQLTDIEVPNPSQKAFEITGLYGVAESCALESSTEGDLLIQKTKGHVTDQTNNFTFAVALDYSQCRRGHIEIVGAGPGDPELISVRGKRMLEKADLVLYAGSLVPRQLTEYAPEGCVVRSSAGLDLEEQFALMKEFYDQGKFVVRLHTGDPCIYGAIQEQMAFFDEYHMQYHITPGISSFQAAAAELKSQFTIPEKVQSIILTRGEGRTPMPEKEQLHKLAQSQSTMCIYLSAGIVEEVQRELLMAYPPETPVAACYKLTWKEQKIYRGQLKDLAKIVKENNLTLTTLLVVSEAIDNRKGLSKLYSSHFTHLFREAKD